MPKDVSDRVRRALSAAFVVSAALTASCGSDDAPASAPPTTQEVYAGARTTAPATVAAGDEVVVSCLVVDAQGNASQPPKDTQLAIVYVPSDAVRTDAAGKTTAVRAGQVDVRCTFPWLGVGDPVGAQMAITPGPVASVDTALSTTSLVAGGGLTATCTAHDAFGNVVPDAKPAFTSAPTDAGNVLSGMTAKLTHAGIYDLACEIPGTTAHAVPVEVVPGPPATPLRLAGPRAATRPTAAWASCWRQG